MSDHTLIAAYGVRTFKDRYKAISSAKASTHLPTSRQYTKGKRGSISVNFQFSAVPKCIRRNQTARKI
jgi:hypothetical protein